MSKRKVKGPVIPDFIKVGAIVNYHSIIGGPVTSTGHRIEAGPQTLCGSAVVWLSDKSGSVDVDALSEVKA